MYMHTDRYIICFSAYCYGEVPIDIVDGSVWPRRGTHCHCRGGGTLPWWRIHCLVGKVTHGHGGHPSPLKAREGGIWAWWVPIIIVGMVVTG